MKARRVHAAFAGASLGLALACALQGARLVQIERLDRALAQGRGTSADPSWPEARFARAVALAASGSTETALAAEKAFVQQEPGPLRAQMQYNLGNLYLRQARGAVGGDAKDTLPLVELAKQSYRDALRADPGNWDARYNLERALALAPEADDTASDDTEPPPNKERTVTTARVGRKDLP